MRKSLKKFIVILILFMLILTNNGTIVLATEVGNIIAENAEEVPQSAGVEETLNLTEVSEELSQ